MGRLPRGQRRVGGPCGSDEMARRIKRPAAKQEARSAAGATGKPKKLRRNPLARVLATAKFRNRVVKPVGLYKRRPKHRKPDAEPD